MVSDNQYIKTAGLQKLDRQVKELIHCVERVLPPDYALFRKVLLEVFPLDPTQSIQYLPYNQQVAYQDERILTLSLVASLNNRRADKYCHKGVRKNLSRLTFAGTSNLMDIFINRLRCDDEIIETMTGAKGDASVLGILQVDDVKPGRMIKKRIRSIQPLLLVPGIDARATHSVLAFENRNEITKKKMFCLPIYKRTSLSI
jgi:hypothetical protein